MLSYKLPPLLWNRLPFYLIKVKQQQQQRKTFSLSIFFWILLESEIAVWLRSNHFPLWASVFYKGRRSQKGVSFWCPAQDNVHKGHCSSDEKPYNLASLGIIGNRGPPSWCPGLHLPPPGAVLPLEYTTQYIMRTAFDKKWKAEAHPPTPCTNGPTFPSHPVSSPLQCEFTLFSSGGGDYVPIL